jgi:hypothetical protein
MFPRTLTAFLLLALVAIPAAGQFDSYGRWIYSDHSEPTNFRLDLYSNDDVEAVRARWEQLAGVNDVWAGEYTRSEGEMPSTVLLRWDPSSGFAALHVHPCMPALLGIAHGGIAQEPDAIVLTSTLIRGTMPFARRLVKARWGQRRYLIPEDEVKAFCDHTSGLGTGSPNEPVGFLLKEGDQELPVADLPEVPEPYRKFVRRPVTARIVRVRPARARLSNDNARIRIDAGSESGIAPGVDLYASQDGLRIVFNVDRVGRGWAEASRIGWYPIVRNSGVDPARVILHAGTLATTRPE